MRWDLFKLPRISGTYEDKEMQVNIGRFGPYIRHNSAFYSLKKEDDPMLVSEARCIELIEAKRKADREKVIVSFKENPSVQVLNGRWGPYIAIEKNNYKIPKGAEPATLTLEECLAIAAAAPAPKFKAAANKKTLPAKATEKSKKVAKKAPTKKAPAKKASTKKVVAKTKSTKRNSHIAAMDISIYFESLEDSGILKSDDYQPTQLGRAILYAILKADSLIWRACKLH